MVADSFRRGFNGAHSECVALVFTDLNIHIKNFRNHWAITKFMKILYYENLALYGIVHKIVTVCARMFVCMLVHVHACVSVCVHACGCIHACMCTWRCTLFCMYIPFHSGRWYSSTSLAVLYRNLSNTWRHLIIKQKLLPVTKTFESCIKSEQDKRSIELEGMTMDLRRSVKSLQRELPHMKCKYLTIVHLKLSRGSDLR